MTENFFFQVWNNMTVLGPYLLECQVLALKNKLKIKD